MEGGKRRINVPSVPTPLLSSFLHRVSFSWESAGALQALELVNGKDRKSRAVSYHPPPSAPSNAGSSSLQGSAQRGHGASSSFLFKCRIHLACASSEMSWGTWAEMTSCWRPLCKMWAQCSSPVHGLVAESHAPGLGRARPRARARDALGMHSCLGDRGVNQGRCTA